MTGVIFFYNPRKWYLTHLFGTSTVHFFDTSWCLIHLSVSWWVTWQLTFSVNLSRSIYPVVWVNLRMSGYWIRNIYLLAKIKCGLLNTKVFISCVIVSTMMHASIYVLLVEVCDNFNKLQKKVQSHVQCFLMNHWNFVFSK